MATCMVRILCRHWILTSIATALPPPKHNVTMPDFDSVLRMIPSIVIRHLVPLLQADDRLKLHHRLDLICHVECLILLL